MTKLRLLPILALSAALLLPAATATAQDDAQGSPAPNASAAADDTRLAELQALVPESLAGLALRDQLQLAAGETLAGVMSDAERTELDAMLEANDKTLADYAAASALLSITDTDIVVVQAHRISDIDASATIGSWAEILSLNLTEPLVRDEALAGRDVTVVADTSQPDFAPLYLFPAGDVVWMVVAADEALVEEAVNVLGTGTEAAESPAGG
jgi:hypothetical protein